MSTWVAVLLAGTASSGTSRYESRASASPHLCAPSIGRAFAFLRGAGTWTWRPEFGTSLIYLAAFAVPMILLDVLLDARQEEYPLERLPHRFRVAMALGLTLLVTVFAANQVNAFIYFQF